MRTCAIRVGWECVPCELGEKVSHASWVGTCGIGVAFVLASASQNISGIGFAFFLTSASRRGDTILRSRNIRRASNQFKHR